MTNYSKTKAIFFLAVLAVLAHSPAVSIAGFSAGIWSEEGDAGATNATAQPIVSPSSAVIIGVDGNLTSPTDTIDVYELNISALPSDGAIYGVVTHSSPGITWSLEDSLGNSLAFNLLSGGNDFLVTEGVFVGDDPYTGIGYLRFSTSDGYTGSYSAQLSNVPFRTIPVPEPASLSLLSLLSLASLAMFRPRRCFSGRP